MGHSSLWRRSFSIRPITLELSFSYRGRGEFKKEDKKERMVGASKMIMDFKLLLFATLGDWWCDTGYHVRATGLILFSPRHKIKLVYDTAARHLRMYPCRWRHVGERSGKCQGQWVGGGEGGENPSWGAHRLQENLIKRSRTSVRDRGQKGDW